MPANKKESAAPFVPEDRTLPVLRSAVQKCQGCDLYRNATQAVFGELETGTIAKNPKVAIMMIGKQPGDHEDKEGHPFVGPAEKLLDQRLEDIEIDRCKCMSRIRSSTLSGNHAENCEFKKPDMKEIHACRPWLEAELETLRPKLIVCLCAVAAQSLLGSNLKNTMTHGMIG